MDVERREEDRDALGLAVEVERVLLGDELDDLAVGRREEQPARVGRRGPGRVAEEPEREPDDGEAEHERHPPEAGQPEPEADEEDADDDGAGDEGEAFASEHESG